MVATAFLAAPVPTCLRHPCFATLPRTNLRVRGVLRPQHGYHRLLVSCNQQSLPERSLHDTRRTKPSVNIDVTTVKSTVDAGVHRPPWQRLAEQLAKGLAVGALALVLAFSHADTALAARSGGRMGGSNFSAGRSFSSPRSSGMSGLSSGAGTSSRGLSAPSLGGGGSSYSLSWGLAPFGGYGYGGYGYGGGNYLARGGGGSFTDVLVFGLFAVVAFAVITSFLNRNNESDTGYDDERVAVARVQVGLLGSARSLQRQLDRLASRADTTTPAGLHYVLQETVLALLRHPEYAVYGASDVSKSRSLEGGENRFNRLSMEERGKFKEETLVNVGGRSRSQGLSRGGGDGIQELIVITLLVAVQGDLKVPRITSRDELVQALNRLGAVRAEQVMAVEVLWTPQAEDDTYTRDELFFDYPSLNTL